MTVVVESDYFKMAPRIRAFVEDAYDSAHIVCKLDAPPREAVGRIPHFEFERTLRIYSVMIHALMTGKIAGEANPTDWDRCRAILSRHDLSAAAPIPPDTVAEPSQ